MNQYIKDKWKHINSPQNLNVAYQKYTTLQHYKSPRSLCGNVKLLTGNYITRNIAVCMVVVC